MAASSAAELMLPGTAAQRLEEKCLMEAGILSTSLVSPIHDAAARGDLIRLKAAFVELEELRQQREDKLPPGPTEAAAQIGHSTVGSFDAMPDPLGDEQSDAAVEKLADSDVEVEDFSETGRLEKLLRELDVSVLNYRDSVLSTPLHWAASAGHVHIVEFLVSRDKVDLDARNVLGDTPLHSAAWRHHPGVVEALLHGGADHRIKNRDGKLPTDLVRGGDPAGTQVGSLLRLWKGSSGPTLDFSEDSDSEYSTSAASDTD